MGIQGMHRKSPTAHCPVTLKGVILNGGLPEGLDSQCPKTVAHLKQFTSHSPPSVAHVGMHSAVHM